MFLNEDKLEACFRWQVIPHEVPYVGETLSDGFRN